MLHKSVSSPLMVFFFFSLVLFHCVWPFLSHSLISSRVCCTCFGFSFSFFFYLHISLRRLPLRLNGLLCSHLSCCFLLSLLSSVPVALTSCPGVEGGNGRGREGMLILSARWRSAEGETGGEKREGERKCHSSEEMRWAVCVCLNRKDHGDSLSDISCIFRPLCLAPLLSKWYVCIYVCACVCVRVRAHIGANANMCTLCI